MPGLRTLRLCGWTRAITKPTDVGWQRPVRAGLSGISSRRRERMVCFRPQPGGLNHIVDRARGWSGRSASSRAGCVRSGSPGVCGLGEAADLSATQTEIDEGEKLAGRSDAGDVQRSGLVLVSTVHGTGARRGHGWRPTAMRCSVMSSPPPYPRVSWPMSIYDHSWAVPCGSGILTLTATSTAYTGASITSNTANSPCG